jgi:hypothetical protein
MPKRPPDVSDADVIHARSLAGTGSPAIIRVPPLGNLRQRQQPHSCYAMFDAVRNVAGIGPSVNGSSEAAHEPPDLA